VGQGIGHRQAPNRILQARTVVQKSNGGRHANSQAASSPSWSQKNHCHKEKGWAGKDEGQMCFSVDHGKAA